MKTACSYCFTVATIRDAALLYSGFFMCNMSIWINMLVLDANNRLAAF